MTDTTSKDRIADKVRKLFNIAADDSASAEEIDNAIRHAQRLMAKHHIDESDLAHEPADDYQRVDTSEFGEQRCWVNRQIYMWESYLAGFIKDFVGVGAYVDRRKREARKPNGFVITQRWKAKLCMSVVFYGVAEDVAIAKELYDELRVMLMTCAQLKYSDIYRGSGALYCEGFVAGLKTKIKEAAKLSASSSSTAMILVSRQTDLVQYKQKAAENWLTKERNIKLGKARGGSSHRNADGSAYWEGKHDGANADVSAARRKKLS